MRGCAVSLRQPGLHLQCSTNGIFGILLVRCGDAKDGDDAIALILHDNAAVLLNGLPHQRMHDIDDHTPVFGVHVLGQGSGADDVAEEDGDDAPLFGVSGGE